MKLRRLPIMKIRFGDHTRYLTSDIFTLRKFEDIFLPWFDLVYPYLRLGNVIEHEFLVRVTVNESNSFCELMFEYKDIVNLIICLKRINSVIKCLAI